MGEIAALTPSYRGISYPRLDGGGLQWPCPAADHPGTPVLNGERFLTAADAALRPGDRLLLLSADAGG
jgi:predicted molibdopterin-dependent oxidoreductase YjgC